MAFVYILRCNDGTLYTGSAKDLAARLKKHNAGTAARYTRGRRPVCLVWYEETESWSAALKKEHAVKQLSRKKKEVLLAQASPCDPHFG